MIYMKMIAIMLIKEIGVIMILLRRVDLLVREKRNQPSRLYQEEWIGNTGFLLNVFI
jgi:hypothetical protein